jgi:heme o synthase
MSSTGWEERQGTVVARCSWRERASDYAALTKLRLAALVLVTTLAGFLLALRGTPDGWRLIATLIGTGLTALGANALNQWMEARLDARMNRTGTRPLPAGRISPRHAVLLSGALLLAGPLFLLTTVNALTAAMAAACAATYAAIYTPLKRRTSLCTLVGAVCGAMPPVMGWTAATGRLDVPAIVLAAILLVWQVPHFLALAWLYREDYERTGFRMLPLVDPTGAISARMAILYSLVLIPIGLTAVLVGLGGWTYAAASATLGLALVVLAVKFQRSSSERNARRLFHATLAYLPALLAFMIADRGPVW